MAKKELSLNTKVANWAKARLGQRVGDGSCFALVYHALKESGAKTAYDYGKVTPKANYVWGEEVNLRKIEVGYLLQFRNHMMTEITELKGQATFPDRSTGTWTQNITKVKKRGHHSAIVSRYDGGKCLLVYEQHVTTPGKKKESVQENMICLEATDRLMGFPAKPYKLHLNNPGDVLKLMKFFGKKDIAKVKKAYPKGVVTMTETSRVEWTEVKGIIWAYKPEPA